MPDVEVTSEGSAGTAFSADTKVIRVRDGRRGPKGNPGDQGDQGDDGAPIVVRGEWVTGTTYSPLDAVKYRSSLVDHIWSMYVQISSVPSSVSDTPPDQDAARWQEIGPYEWGSYLGGIWEIEQLNHGFTKVGQPVAYSFQADEYVLANARRADEMGIAIVREVKSADRAVLQSSGEVPNIDPDVITPSGSSWEPGRIYYVSSARGFVQRDAPWDPNYYANPILLATDVFTPSGRNGVALPWAPTNGVAAQTRTVVGMLKYYFTQSLSGATSVSGPDDNGLDLEYIVSTSTDVFLNGLNLVDGDDFTATDGVTINFTEALTAGDIVEIWTPDRPLELLIPSTVVKLDNIETQFDGVETTFVVGVSMVDLAVQNTANFMIWLDGNAQEALVDYIIIEDPAQPASDIAAIQFTKAPDPATKFWGLVFVPNAQPDDAFNFPVPVHAVAGGVSYGFGNSSPSAVSQSLAADELNLSGADVGDHIRLTGDEIEIQDGFFEFDLTFIATVQEGWRITVGGVELSPIVTPPDTNGTPSRIVSFYETQAASGWQELKIKNDTDTARTISDIICKVTLLESK